MRRTFRHCAKCRNVLGSMEGRRVTDVSTLCRMSKGGVGEEWAFITAHYDVVPNVEMRSRSPTDVLGGMGLSFL